MAGYPVGWSVFICQYYYSAFVHFPMCIMHKEFLNLKNPAQRIMLKFGILPILIFVLAITPELCKDYLVVYNRLLQVYN